ncbi:MAG: hypothetical protein DMG88_20315 [Acidobacteria bacterium]|nr:MAG: hypothetical protein DMG88_20315 [Acidobacteriota bacterium]
MLMRILCAVLLYQGMLATAGLAQDTKQEAATTTCTFEDGTEISVRYIPVETNKEKIQNGKVWAPGGSPIVLFTPAALTLEKSQIPAGAFSLYLIPQRDRWTLVVNKNVSAGSRYDERQDIARAAMEMGQLACVWPHGAEALQLARVFRKDRRLGGISGKIGCASLKLRSASA